MRLKYLPIAMLLTTSAFGQNATENFTASTSPAKPGLVDKILNEEAVPELRLLPKRYSEGSEGSVYFTLGAGHNAAKSKTADGTGVGKGGMVTADIGYQTRVRAVWLPGYNLLGIGVGVNSHNIKDHYKTATEDATTKYMLLGYALKASINGLFKGQRNLGFYWELGGAYNIWNKPMFDGKPYIKEFSKTFVNGNAGLGIIFPVALRHFDGPRTGMLGLYYDRVFTNLAAGKDESLTAWGIGIKLTILYQYGYDM